MVAYQVGQAVELKIGTRGSIVEVYRSSDKGAQRDMGFYLFRNGINGTEFTVRHTEIARASVPTQPQQCQQQQGRAGDTMIAVSDGFCGIPDGTRGVAWRAGGFYDPDSTECEAWMFQPDDEPGAAYYCSREKLIAL